jgi:limonene-1,2-epoxide hydrolase
MSDMSGRIILFIVVFAITSGDAIVWGQAGPLRRTTQEVIEALGRYAGRHSGRDVGRELLELGGEAGVQRIAARIAREGGEEAVQRAIRLTEEFGPDALRALNHAPNTTTLLRAIDDLPAEGMEIAIRRLAAGAEGRVLAETVERAGVAALRAEVRHPGVGGAIVRHLGDDGAELASRFSTDRARQLAAHAPDIALLPPAERAGVIRLFREQPDGMFQWIGRFVRENPGKVLFTTGTAAVLIARPEYMLGDPDLVAVEGADGTVVYARRQGLPERIMMPVINRVLAAVLPVISLGAFAWVGIYLWGRYRISRCKVQVAEMKAVAEISRLQITPDTEPNADAKAVAEPEHVGSEKAGSR